MAENNNNAFTVTITPETFNGIITGNGNGTYNVTYTSLTEDQIREIGQQFAKYLSDTDENGNSKAGLHKVALTGDYTQLENKPSASKLQGFHEVAFSGNASALNNGTGNNVTFLTKTAFDASVAGKIKQSDVNSWNAKSDFSGNYEDLNNAPALPEDINNESDAYETIDNERFIRPFHNIAFTGNYDELINKYYILNLGQFKYTKNNNQEYQLISSSQINILENLGFNNEFIKNINNLYYVYTNDSDQHSINLVTALLELQQNFQNGKICYLTSNNRYFLITHIESQLNNDIITNMSINCINYISNNFNTTFSNNTINSDNDINNILTNIQIENYISTIIIDLKNYIIYSRFTKTYPIEFHDNSLAVDQYNRINVAISSKPNNKIELITQEGLEGLYVSSGD